ncbi:MAG: immunoglobulin domain-containing protein [Verrucomicrobiae bacterium]|nr:immunoglobulin domain-containing protein [Verrucomicrobiae bacterium]
MVEPAFAEFKAWTQRYFVAAPEQRPGLLPEGVQLAATRRIALKALIKQAPERALQLAVPAGVRAQLPTEVIELFEENISARGTLAVLGALAEPGHETEIEPTFRIATIGEREYQTYTYGERFGVPTRQHIALNGIAVDNFFALSEDALRILDADETAQALAANPDPLCAITGQSAAANQAELAAELEGEIVFFCRPEHASQQNESIVAADGGPPSPDGGDPSATAWTEGEKKLLFIRVDFPDLEGVNLSDGGVTNLVNNLNKFYREMSYGRASFASNGFGSDYTPVFRMEHPAAYYGTNNYYNQLRTEARAAATAAGYALTNFNFDIICMGAVPGFSWSGLAYVGGAGAWLRNNFSTGVAGHELGHNFGLNHANFWNTSGASIIGPGTSTEYGDSFDTMGAASAGNNHFNARYKHYLNWLTTNEVLTVSTSGTYRVYCHDNPNATGLRGLKIIKNSSTNYWVEFRQKFTSNKWLMSGAGLRWAQNGNQKSQLLDTTPGSPDGKSDSALGLGRTFSDFDAGIHITTIGKGGTSPESLDVVINLGAFPMNHAPQLNLTASATELDLNETASFSASATDPDDDTLAYYWDFGDGTFGTNSPIAAKNWNTKGDYLVRCVVSDMKGGSTSRWVTVRVGAPTTFRISGQINCDGNPLADVRVYVSSTRMGYTDADGNYAIPGLPAGAYTVAASRYDYAFTQANFTNPVSVGPDAEAIDFLASEITYPPTIGSQPLSQTVAVGSTVTFNVVANGTPPFSYQWRFNGTNWLGGDGASLILSEVQTNQAGSYTVTVSNAYGSVISAAATLTIGEPPVILASPVSQRVLEGSDVTFTVEAVGSPVLLYQWQHNGSNVYSKPTLGGSNGDREGSNIFTRTNVEPLHAGNYSVVVSSRFGQATSATALLTVSVRPQLSLPQLANGQMRLQLSGTPGDRYVIESSTNFLNWDALATVTNLTGQVWYLDPENEIRPEKFYRGKLLP